MRLVRLLILGMMVVMAGGFYGCAALNNYQTKGTLKLANLKQPVEVVRDEKGMAYIRAGNLDDLLMAQGFVMAQDRLFQMEITRMAAKGRISELMGEKARSFDIRMRTFGFYRNAQKHVLVLGTETRRYFDDYIQGVNAYIQTRPKSRSLELKLAGIEPELWTAADVLSILYYMSWGTAANLETEIIAQMLLEKVGPERVQDILPLNINPDEPEDLAGPTGTIPVIGKDAVTVFTGWRQLPDAGINRVRIGSNNWTTIGKRSISGKPIVASDPHLEAATLPGPWYPCGLITPDFRAVGVVIPGLPGLIIFRSDRIAVGITNAYGDAQDLYVETGDPNDPTRYMEGGLSRPFEVIEETLVIKDKKSPGGIRKEPITIRLTRRGPVVSDVLPGFTTDKIITLRWSPFETMGPGIGIDRLLVARSVAEAREALSHANLLMLNFVFADTAGHIGWQASGRLPIRSQKEGTFPYVVNSAVDNWTGWIPYDKMPQRYDPERGWIATCNHHTVDAKYPYYYSSYQASSYRYRRIKQLLEQPGKKSVDDHWAYQRDTLNLMAQAIAPVMAEALNAHEDTKKLGSILSRWDFHDDADQVAPSIFQATYRRFAQLVFTDELGEKLASTMLGSWYFWQERLQRMVLENDSPWFDDQGTTGITETRDDLFHKAAVDATKELADRWGHNPEKWRWGKVHRIEYLNPIRKKGIGKGLLGGGSYGVAGSCETLHRNIYDFNHPFDVIISDSLRMVADLGDPEKVLAVLPGGVTGRTFHPHARDQIQPFMNGEKVYWWLSDTAIAAHTKTTLILNP